ncbi:MAG TPA: thermopsin family protease, partial [Thermoplasmata archaeon]|nr:thermopsin family protease [Thermoplasmata archaeon]
GSGWQTYDNVTFPWAHGGWRDDGFVVDGTKYLPNNLFYDAEWVYGGPGNGLSSDNLASNFTMGLEYWNGHNYQAVPNAFNFGSDTGESMHNVSESTGLGAGAVGLPGATVTVGNSPLTKLYTRSDVSIVNVTTPLASATLTFGSLRVPFTGKEANVTLAPGSYEVRLWNGSLAVAVRNISVGAGEYLALNMTTVYYPSSVSFASSGLPQGLGWSVVIANQTFRSSGATLTVELVNGTYPYRIVPVPGYFLAQYDGTLGVVGRAVTLTVLWQVFVYPVTVEAVGLPSGVPWTVSIQGTSGGAGGGATSMNDSAVVELANGSYRYSVTIRYEYVAIVNPDTFTVLAGATSLTVQFAVRMGFLVGSVEPASARLEIAAEPVALASDGSFNTTLRPGLYSISAAAPGFTAFFTNVTVTAGNATTLTVQLKATGHSPGGGSNGTPTTPSQSPRDLLLSPVLWAGVALALVAVVGALAALSFRRRRR